MKNLSLSIVLLLFVCSSSYSQESTSSSKLFSVQELQEDFTYWRQRMEKTHPLLYLYQSKSTIDQAFDRIYASIDKPMDELTFFKVISPMSAIVKDGHNTIAPSASTLNWLISKDHLLPLDISLIDPRMYVEGNFSTKTLPEVGSQIISIDGVTPDQIFETILPTLTREGDGPLPFTLLNNTFKFYYHLYFGLREEYLIEYMDGEELKSCSLKAKSLETIRAVKVKDKNFPTYQPLQLEILDEQSTAVLTINTFDLNDFKKEYKVNFKKTMAAYFNQINAKKIENLIVDVRENGGGNPDYVKVVLQYLFDEPFEQTIECRIVKDSSKEKFEERTKKKWYPLYGIGTFKPKKNNFRGKIYVLISETTYSAGVAFAAVLRKYDRATFIGRETSGNPVIMGGYFIKNLWKLPHTKIEVRPSTLCTIDEKIELNKGRGLRPDHVIQKEIPSIGGRDSGLEFALGLIKE